MVQALRHQPVPAETWVQSQNGRCRICAEQCATRYALNRQCTICAGQCTTRYAPSTSISISILRLNPTLYNLSSYVMMFTVTVGKCSSRNRMAVCAVLKEIGVLVK
jgi:hypothetical protein